jgi:hypothetical protein
MATGTKAASIEPSVTHPSRKGSSLKIEPLTDHFALYSTVSLAYLCTYYIGVLYEPQIDLPRGEQVVASQGFRLEFATTIPSCKV